MIMQGTGLIRKAEDNFCDYTGKTLGITVDVINPSFTTRAVPRGCQSPRLCGHICDDCSFPFYSQMNHLKNRDKPKPFLLMLSIGTRSHLSTGNPHAKRLSLRLQTFKKGYSFFPEGTVWQWYGAFLRKALEFAQKAIVPVSIIDSYKDIWGHQYIHWRNHYFVNLSGMPRKGSTCCAALSWK